MKTIIIEVERIAGVGSANLIHDMRIECEMTPAQMQSAFAAFLARLTHTEAMSMLREVAGDLIDDFKEEALEAYRSKQA